MDPQCQAAALERRKASNGNRGSLNVRMADQLREHRRRLHRRRLQRYRSSGSTCRFARRSTRAA